MKLMLSLFVLTILCSYALSSQTETCSNSLMSSSTSALWKRKDSILPSGAAIHSKNGKYSLTMNASTCEIIVKKKSGKVLYTTLKTKKRNCYAILRGNSNFEIMSGKVTVWSTNTSTKQKGKGPYRLTLDNKGNAIVRNNESKCSWALFGCPVSKKKLNKIKNASPKNAFKLIKKLMRQQAKKRKGLPIKQLPIARGAPKIKNQLPKVLTRKSKPLPKKKLAISKKKAKNLKKALKNGGKDAVKKITNALKGKATKKEIKQIKKLIKNGKSWNEIKKIAMKKAKRKVKKAIKKIKKQNKVAKKMKPKKIQTKKQLVNVVKKLTWMQKIKRSIMKKENPNKIKNMMKKLGNVRGNVRFWNKMTTMIQTKNWNQCARLIALPAAQSAQEFRKPKVWVSKKKYVRYYARWKTWRWVRTYRNYWARVCRGYWFWRRCWNTLRRSYYNYRYYYWTGAYRYKYVYYRKLE